MLLLYYLCLSCMLLCHFICLRFLLSYVFCGWVGCLVNRNEYDRNVRCFSPEGRLYQVEYAIEAIKLGTTAVGIATSEGVILAVEKRLSSPLIEPASVQKILEVGKRTIYIKIYMCITMCITMCINNNAIMNALL